MFNQLLLISHLYVCNEIQNLIRLFMLKGIRFYLGTKVLINVSGVTMTSIETPTQSITIQTRTEP